MKQLRNALLIAAAVFVLWLAVGVGSAQVVCAHDPRFACSSRDAAHAIIVPDPGKSWAYYGRLAPHENDVYTFTVTEPINVPATLLIEASDANNPARPSARIMNDAGKSIATIGFEQSERFHEPFSGIDYLTTPDRRYAFPPGHYTVTISVAGGTEPQRYVFAIGEAERFGVGEIPYVLGAIYRVKTRGY